MSIFSISFKLRRRSINSLNIPIFHRFSGSTGQNFTFLFYICFCQHSAVNATIFGNGIHVFAHCPVLYVCHFYINLQGAVWAIYCSLLTTRRKIIINNCNATVSDKPYCVTTIQTNRKKQFQ